MVYVISDGSGYVKIGKADDIGKRIESLQCGNPRNLECILSFDTKKCKYGDTALENALHNHFANRRVSTTNIKKTEWFHDTILDELKSFSSEKLDFIVNRNGYNICCKDTYMNQRKKKKDGYPEIFDGAHCIEIVSKLRNILLEQKEMP